MALKTYSSTDIMDSTCAGCMFNPMSSGKKIMKKLYFQSLAVAFMALFTLTSCELFFFDNPTETEEEQTDTRIKMVIPEDLLELVKGYMPVYDGVNPPNIEGTFLIDPYIYIFDSNGNWEAGDQLTSFVLKFTNQDNTTNTLDYEGKHTDNSSYQSGKGVFISGSGNDFTIFFNVEGYTYSDGEKFWIKDALIISGTMTPNGIKNLRRAFVVVDKSDDPEKKIIDVGVFRVFKDQDELCVPANWEDYNGMMARGLGVVRQPSLNEKAK